MRRPVVRFAAERGPQSRQWSPARFAGEAAAHFDLGYDVAAETLEAGRNDVHVQLLQSGRESDLERRRTDRFVQRVRHGPVYDVLGGMQRFIAKDSVLLLEP